MATNLASIGRMPSQKLTAMDWASMSIPENSMKPKKPKVVPDARPHKESWEAWTNGEPASASVDAINETQNPLPAAKRRATHLLLLHPLVVWISHESLLSVIVALNQVTFSPGGAPPTVPSLLDALYYAFAPLPYPFWPLIMSTIAAAINILWSLLVWACCIKCNGCCCTWCILLFAALHFIEAANEAIYSVSPLLIATAKEGMTFTLNLLVLLVFAFVPNAFAAFYSTLVATSLMSVHRAVTSDAALQEGEPTPYHRI